MLSILCVVIVAVSCNKDDDNKNNNTLNLNATAEGSQEVPAVTTPASGTLTGTYNKDTKELSYTLTWNNLKDSATLAHFHGPAPTGQNAGILITIFNTRKANSGTISGTTTLADTTLAHFQNGKIYVNVHSKVHGGGEIRGQVTLQ